METPAPAPEGALLDADGVSDVEIRDREVRSSMGVHYSDVAVKAPLKRRVFEWVYNPRFELVSFLLIVVSITMLIVEIAIPEKDHSGWLAWLGPSKEHEADFFFWSDLGLTAFFAVEYALKLWIAPRKWFFVRANWIDLLAILPVLRVFRLSRGLRLVRLFRLLRLMRIGRYVQQMLDDGDGVWRSRSVENEIVLIYLLFSLVFGTVGILVFEKGHNDGFANLGDGLWWCVVTMTTVGYGDISPITPGGKVVAGVVMFIGLTFWALLTGTVSSVIIDRAKRRNGEIMVITSLERHIVVCGWNESGLELVNDLLASRSNPHVVILQPDDDLPRLSDPNVHYVFEDPTTSKGLQDARVRAASVAVVLADQRGGRAPQDVDARTILAVLAIERLNPAIHSIAELLVSENAFHVQNAGGDEVYVSGAYMGSMLSQAVQYPGLSDVFSDLFDAGTGSQVRERMLPSVLSGKSFSEVGAELFRGGHGILIGYRRATDLVMSPSLDVPLEESDRMILLQRIAK